MGNAWSIPATTILPMDTLHARTVIFPHFKIAKTCAAVLAKKIRATDGPGAHWALDKPVRVRGSFF
jgi:hypothetical protein